MFRDLRQRYGKDAVSLAVSMLLDLAGNAKYSWQDQDLHRRYSALVAEVVGSHDRLVEEDNARALA